MNWTITNVISSTISLFDGKGKPGKAPRLHTVPLIPPAAAALLDCKPQGVYALSTDSGVTHLAAATLSKWAVDYDGHGYMDERRHAFDTLFCLLERLPVSGWM